MLRGKFKPVVIAGLFSVAIGLAPASAAESSSSTTPADGEWAFTFAPYLWVSGLEGDVGFFGLPEVEVDASFSDILDNLDFAFMGVGEVQYGRFGLFADFLYLDLSTGSTSTPGPLFSSAKVEDKFLVFTPMLEYRVLDESGGTLDVMAGMRVWSSEAKIEFSGGLLGGRSPKDSETWVDPTIGLKGRVALDEDWSLTAWSIIGGFGASSDFMWDLFGGVNYEVNDWFSLNAGYRGSGVDYEKDGFVYDTVMHGPTLGLVFTF